MSEKLNQNKKTTTMAKIPILITHLILTQLIEAASKTRNILRKRAGPGNFTQSEHDRLFHPNA